MKKMMYTILVTLLLLVMLFIGSFTYVTKYKKTEVTSYIQDDYCLVIYMVGEPEFPFGATYCRLELLDDHHTIIKHDVTLFNDGKNASKDNFEVSFENDSVVVKVMAEEMSDVYYRFYYNGEHKMWQ